MVSSNVLNVLIGSFDAAPPRAQAGC